jgi:hypothetical protein
MVVIKKLFELDTPDVGAPGLAGFARPGNQPQRTYAPHEPYDFTKLGDADLRG